MYSVRADQDGQIDDPAFERNAPETCSIKIHEILDGEAHVWRPACMSQLNSLADPKCP